MIRGNFMDKDIKRKEIDKIIEKTNKTRYYDSQETLDLAETALSLSQDLGYEQGRALAILRIANAHANMGNYGNALDIIFEALDFFIKESFYDLQFNVFNLVGIVFSELGDYERSMEFYDNAESAAKKIDAGKKYDLNSTTKTSMVLVLNNIAENYKYLSDYNEALNYYNKSFEIDKELNFSASKGVSLLSLGEIYYLLSNYDKAKEFTNKALFYMNHYNYALAESEAYQNLALIFWKKVDYIQAEEYFHKALNKSKEESSPYFQISILTNYYKYLMSQDNFKDALKALKEACDISTENNMVEKMPEISALLAKFYEQRGDCETAFKYFKMHFEHEKTFFDTLHKSRINSLNIKRKIFQMEKEKKEIEENNENLKRESEGLQIIVDKISIISDLGRQITATLNLDSIIDILHFSITNFIDMPYFGIGLYDEINASINYFDIIDNGEKVKMASTSISDKNSTSAKCIKSREIIIINDMSKEYINYVDEAFYKSQNNKFNCELNSLIYSPLLINKKVIGVITIQCKEKNAFTPYHIEMVKSLSSYAAIAVNNAIKSMELEKEVERTKTAQIKLEELNEKLLYLSENDVMTGIPNRRKFDKYINNIWDESILQKSNLSLILFDIDCFKEYNDNYGHLEGDNCIIKIANALSNIGKIPYFASRYGGDEFIIILSNCSINDSLEFSEILKNKIAELNIPHKFSKVIDRVTISIGVASIIPNNNMAINEFIRIADNALYLAKQMGRNQIANI